jgi:YVTN family beta-propeller protein
VPTSLDKFILRHTSVLFRSLALVAVLVSLTSCGDQYRPIVIPITQPSGDPKATHYALVVNSNNGQPADLTTGVGPSATQIDVSGDTNLGNRRTGLNPVHAALSTGFQAFVVNQGESSVSTFFATTGTPTVTAISLEPNAGATFVEASGNLAFVSETNLNRVAILDSSGVRKFVDVGAAPVALSATPDGRKVFVANTGDGTVSVISTQDNALVGSPIAVGGSPAGMAMQTAGSFVYVSNSTGGALSVIDATANQEVQHVPGLSNPSQVVWENTLQRVYVVDPGSNSIKVYNGASSTLSLLRTVNLPGTPIGMAALDSGSKFYVLFGGSPGTVGVYNSQSFQLMTTLTVQNTPVSIAAAPGSSKVYVVNQTGDAGSATPQFPTGSVSIIDTANDTLLNMAAGGAKPVFVTAQ